MQNVKESALLMAVDELQTIADPQIFKSTLNEVLIDWLSSTDRDKDYRGRVLAIFGSLTNFLNDIETAEA
jgi:hypothetical protein